MSTKKSNAIRFLETLRGGPMTFGDLIESIRITDEISQVVLAKKLGISKSHLCDIEKGRRLVSAERAAQFAKVLGYSMNQFIAMAIEGELRKAGMPYKVTLNEAA